MAYTDIYTAATDATSTLRKQVCVAVAKAAADVIAESEATANHAVRLTWARKALSDPVEMGGKWMWKVLENATIQANPSTATDNDVQFVVNSLIDTLAGEV